MKLSDLIKKADGLKEDAFLNRGLITRLKEDNSLENISFDVKVVTRSIFDLREARTVNIDADIKQTLNNIKATQFKLGLLINFGTPSLSYKRIIN